MTVDELIDRLGEMPADAAVVLSIGDHEQETFTVEVSDDGWVVLEG